MSRPTCSFRVGSRFEEIEANILVDRTSRRNGDTQTMAHTRRAHRDGPLLFCKVLKNKDRSEIVIYVGPEDLTGGRDSVTRRRTA